MGPVSEYTWDSFKELRRAFKGPAVKSGGKPSEGYFQVTLGGKNALVYELASNVLYPLGTSAWSEYELRRLNFDIVFELGPWAMIYWGNN